MAMDFNKWTNQARRRFTDAAAQASGYKDRARTAIQKAAKDVSETGGKAYEDAKNSLLRQRFGEEEAAEIKAILIKADDVHEQLTAQIESIAAGKESDPLAAEFFSKLESYQQQEANILFDRQREGRDARLAAKAVIRAYEFELEDTRAYNEIAATAKELEGQYKKLPEGMVQLAKTWSELEAGASGLVTSASVVGEELGKAGRKAAESGWGWVQKKWNDNKPQ